MNRILTIANAISFIRILLSIPLIICIERMNYNYVYFYYSLIVIFFIVISDILDGYIARKYDGESEFGKILDPISDKICLMCVLIYLLDKDPKFLVFFILLSIRDVILLTYTSYLLLYRNIVTQANKWGKLFIFITMLMIIFHLYDINLFFANLFYYLSNIMLIFSMLIYLIEHSERISNSKNV
jgi:CDP-diacylglycerol--glycerol-3-phosphate 3-phosphatidyltransferase